MAKTPWIIVINPILNPNFSKQNQLKTQRIPPTYPLHYKNGHTPSRLTRTHKMYLVPWLRSFNDDCQRIMKVTYFAGNLKVYLSNDIYKHQYKCYLESIKSPNVTFTNNSFDSTFLVSGLSPDIEEVDKKAFETKFGCKVLFFIKSRNNRLPIPRAVVKADIGTRDALLTQRCFFQWMENFFTPTKFRNWTITSFLDVLGVSNRDIGLSNVRKNDVFVHTVQDSIQARI
ncbi:hypothetical protein ACOME3_007523, partial [Neoechinorhynchus agilis]